jgi:ribonucleoside-diphosphate reductase alpha chain
MSLQETILQERYCQPGETTWEDICKRVANEVGKSEKEYEQWNKKFYDELLQMNFIPGGRILTGGKSKMNCNTSYVDDSRESIGEMLKDVLMISGTGGGVGISFSNLRYKGAPIKTVGGESSGSVSFMHCADVVAGTIKTGGGRRAAMMLSLSVYHPDIEQFLHEKLDLKSLKNANVSVEIDRKFIQAVKDDSDWNLIWAGKIIKTVKAKEIWNKLIHNAWKSGEPGIINLGLMRELSNSYYTSEISTTNPCGEQPLPAYGSCCLGSINLYNFCKDGKFDRKRFEETIDVSVRFLDDILDINEYPLDKIRQVSTTERRVGLGIMGLHYAMVACGIKYSSSQGIDFVEKVFEILRNRSYWVSTELAKEKGAFSKFDVEKYLKGNFVKRLPVKIREKIRTDGIRNMCLNTLAPTGTTSIIANVSSGIEPIFSPVYKRTFWSGDKQKHEIVADDLFATMKKEGKDITVFEGSHDITPESHIMIQEAAQYYIDSAVSKTINLPKNYPVDELSDLVLKYINNIKGITFYREGSRGDSPLTPISIEKYKENDKNEDVAKDIKCVSGVCEL